MRMIIVNTNETTELENDKKTYTLNDLKNKLINEFMNDEVNTDIFKDKVELLRVILEKE